MTTSNSFSSAEIDSASTAAAAAWAKTNASAVGEPPDVMVAVYRSGVTGKREIYAVADEAGGGDRLIILGGAGEQLYAVPKAACTVESTESGTPYFVVRQNREEQAAGLSPIQPIGCRNAIRGLTPRQLFARNVLSSTVEATLLGRSVQTRRRRGA